MGGVALPLYSGITVDPTVALLNPIIHRMQHRENRACSSTVSPPDKAKVLASSAALVGFCVRGPVLMQQLHVVAAGIVIQFIVVLLPLVCCACALTSTLSFTANWVQIPTPFGQLCAGCAASGTCIKPFSATVPWALPPGGLAGIDHRVDFPIVDVVNTD